MICPNCGKTVADIATTCPECRSTIGPMDPETQAELIAQRKEKLPSRGDAGRGGASRSWVLAPLRLLAVFVTVAVIFAGTAGIPRLTRGRIKLAPKITTLEETIAKAHNRWLSKRRSTNANYLAFLALLGIAVLVAPGGNLGSCAGGWLMSICRGDHKAI